MSFRFRPFLAVCTLIAFAILVALGLWQLQRLEWKRDLIARADRLIASAPVPIDEALARAAAGEEVEYAPVFVDGVYAHDLEARVFGTLEGAPGAYLFTPLDAPAPGAFSGEVEAGSSSENATIQESGGRRFVYVNRGFVPQRLAEGEGVGRPAGDLRVAGLLRRAEAPEGLARLFAPEDQPRDNLWFVRDPLRLAAHHGIATMPWYIDSNGAESPGLWPKGGTTRLDFSNRHFEYALTWFALAAALVGVYIVFSLRRD